MRAKKTVVASISFLCAGCKIIKADNQFLVFKYSQFSSTPNPHGVEIGE